MYYVDTCKDGYEIKNSLTGKGLATTPNLLDALHYTRICNREDRNVKRKSERPAALDAAAVDGLLNA